MTFVIKITGMPYSATCEEVAVFLAGLDILGGRKNGVHLTKEESGRPSGEGYVELTCREDMKKALGKDHEYIGDRWVNVTESTYAEMEADLDAANRIKKELDDTGVYIVKIRGIPWSCTVDDLENFFKGSQIKVDKDTSIHILKNAEGRLTGQAFVEFADQDSLEKALARDKQHLGKRYLEIERSGDKDLTRFREKAEITAKNKDPVVLCRGLPWSATEDDVCNFFAGLEVTNIQMVYDADGERPMGKCFVEFSSTADSDQAIKKFGEKIGSRYVEVFQSNKKYWYDRELGEGVPAPRAEPPRSRIRPSPYERPFAEPHDMGYPPRRGAAPGRVKRISHGRGGGYDGARGYEMSDTYPVPKFPTSGGGAGPKAPQRHMVIVKGVPMDTSLGDIIKFFTESNPPKNVEMKFGEAVVEFNSHADAMRAMLKDKTNLGSVRVTLELQSKPEDYTGYSPAASQVPPAAADPYADPYAHSNPYQSAAPQMGGASYRW